MQNEPTALTSEAFSITTDQPEKLETSNLVQSLTPNESPEASQTQPANAPKRKSEIWVTTDFLGFHRWANALDEVEYLRALHRHKFNVKVWHPVLHPDRDVEFHLFKTQVRVAVIKTQRVLANSPEMSCEMIGEEILRHLESEGWKPSRISVDEDGECGATLETL